MNILNVTELPKVFFGIGDQAETCSQLFYVKERFYGFEKTLEEDIDRFITYLLFEKKSEQTVRNLLKDFKFLPHRYFMQYRIENDTVYVDNIFHELQDYKNKMN